MAKARKNQNYAFGRKRFTVMLILAFFLAMNAFSKTSDLPEIRYTEKNPFSEGKAWDKADTLTGFSIPKKLDIALDQSEAKLLYDNENLYIYLKAFESSPLKKGKDANPFQNDNFEIFIQPDPSTDTYYHIAISSDGKLYASQKGNTSWGHKIKSEISKGKNFWEAKLTIPLSSINIKTPVKNIGEKIRFNICRNDISAPGEKAIPSSFALLNLWDYHVPDWWAEAIMTENAGAPRKITNKSSRLNIFTNPEFDLSVDGKPSGWNLSKGVSRQETMAMSEEWIVKATGKTYVIMKKGVDLVPEKVYTIKIKARKFGNEGALGIIQLLKDQKGKIKEGSYDTWQMPLTNEFREYCVPLKAAKGLYSIAFYRLGTKDNASGVDIASARLYEGKVSSFEIRKVARSGGKKAIPGTGIKLKANLHGKPKGPIKILAIVKGLENAIEPQAIFAGMDAQTDILTTTGKDQDVYYTEGTPDAIEQNLKAGKYDLYMIGHRAVERVGKELENIISGNVLKGAGIIINDISNSGNFKELLKKYPPKEVSKSHYLKKGLPVALYPLRKSRKKPQLLLDPSEKIMESNAEKGRIIITDTSSEAAQDFLISLDPDSCSYWAFPCKLYSNAWLARLAYYAAGKKISRIDDLSSNGNAFNVKCQKVPEGSTLEWNLCDKNGKELAKGNAKPEEASIPLAAMLLSGNYALAVWLKDKNGNVLDYCVETIKNNGPRIAKCISSKESYKGNEDAVFTIDTKNANGGMDIEWTLEDFSGRILESGKSKAADSLKIKAPLKSVYTNLARLWVCLKDKGNVLDAQRFPVYLQDNDRKRLWNDYTPSVWPTGRESSEDFEGDIARVMEEIGIRSYLLPLHGCPSAMNYGFGVGGSFRGGGYPFCALYPSKNHVRQPSLSDPEILKMVKDRARRSAKKEQKYGIVHTVVCDEPNDAKPSSNEEIDADPENIKEYRKRMKAKYGTIEKFNKRCSTNYAGFEELGLILTEDARKRKNFAEFIEWRNYNVDRWVEAIRLVSDSAKSVDPEAPLSLYNSFGQRALSCNDYWKLLTKAGLDFSHEYTTMVYMGKDPFYSNFDELYRSFRPDMRVWGFIGYYWSPSHAKFQPWWFALHRFGGFTWFAATAGVGGGGGSRWLNLLDVPTLGLNLESKLLKEHLNKSGLLDGLGKLFLEYEWKKPEIAVMYSQPSLLAAWCLGTEQGRDQLVKGSPYCKYHHSRNNLRYMLEDLLYQYNFVSCEQIDNGILDSYKILILPKIIALSESNVQKLKKFLGKGGVIITDSIPGKYDELGTPRNERPFLKEIEKGSVIVFQDTFDDRNDAQCKQMLDLLKKHKAEPVAYSDSVPSLKGREAMHFVNGNMNVYGITRNFKRTSDNKNQSFTFPTEGHLYDLREGKYLGKTNETTVAIPNAETKVYGHYPYKVEELQVNVPSAIEAGKDLVAEIKIKPSRGKAGLHIIHTELIPPGTDKTRWFMKRNLSAPEGKVNFKFRMAENDPAGKWTLLVKDIMTGITVKKNFMLTSN